VPRIQGENVTSIALSSSLRPAARCLRVALAATACAALATACANPQDATTASASGATRKPAAVTVERDPALFAMVPETFKEAGRIQVATNAPFAPFEMFSGDGQKKLTGLEIDLGHALGQRLGVPFEFSQQPFDGLLPGLQAKKYDVLMAALFDTEAREKSIDFVNYGRSGSVLLVRKGNPGDVRTLDDLCGKQAAAQTGAQQISLLDRQTKDCVADGKKGITVRTYPQFSDALLALKTSKADLIAGDLGALRYAAKQDTSVEAVEDPAAPNGYDPQSIGIGLPKGQPTFREAVRRALADLIEDGSYRKILDTYGVGNIAVKKPTVNRTGS
jgi:polar amino acid transport system substrate-binding protein